MIQENHISRRHWIPFVMGFLHFIIVCYILSSYFPLDANNPYYKKCSVHTPTETLTFIREGKYFIVSAYRDHREGRFIRVISIINRDHLTTPLFCTFCCAQETVQATEAQVMFHSLYFGFTYAAAYVICPDQPSCNATHVKVIPYLQGGNPDLPYLPVQNKNIRDQSFPFDITVCFSNVLGSVNNNVLQLIQSIELYKLLGVQKMFIYNNSCSPEVEKVLQYYQKEHTLDIISWPIDQYIQSGTDWSFKGEVHNSGQLAVMNDCIYRNMDQARYVLLADLQQIIVPYKHSTLPLLLSELQKQHSDVTEFLFETHVLPTSVSYDEGRFDLPEWRSVPGVNILKHVYKIPVGPEDFLSTKMIVNPRAIKQTAVFYVIRKSGETLHVPNDMATVLQFSDVEIRGLGKENFTLDYRIWDFGNQLIPKINEVLQNVSEKVRRCCVM
uniref:Glycosyltransferase family 92 protein n=1 Tax=Electrophorus electricus TaxID=8005 RepID=A0A4W4FRC9_ELEEL